MNIYEKILAVMTDVEYLQKDGRVSSEKVNYNFLSEEKITANVRNSMIDHKLVMFPVNCCQVISQTGFDEIIMTYRFLDVEAPDSFIDVQTKGCGYDKGDKKSYKAMTGAFKYAMRQTFMISTGDDPDKEASEKTAAKIAEAAAKAAAKAASKPKSDFLTEVGKLANKIKLLDFETLRDKYNVKHQNEITDKETQEAFYLELKKLVKMVEAK